jgi:uncharacterized MAPEG superfamily protein
MGLKEGTKVFMSCMTAYLLNALVILAFNNYGLTPIIAFGTSLVRMSGWEGAMEKQPQFFSMATLIYLVFLWATSHLAAITLGGYATEETKDKKWSNREPRRNPELHLHGSLQSRLYSSHLNAGEQFSFIAAGVLGCIIMQVPYVVINKYCSGIILFRTLFHVFYAAGWATFRSLSYEFGFGCMLCLLFNAALGASTFESFLSFR